MYTNTMRSRPNKNLMKNSAIDVGCLRKTDDAGKIRKLNLLIYVLGLQGGGLSETKGTRDQQHDLRGVGTKENEDRDIYRHRVPVDSPGPASPPFFFINNILNNK